jgi:hypothetical protein
MAGYGAPRSPTSIRFVAAGRQGAYFRSEAEERLTDPLLGGLRALFEIANSANSC